MALLRVYFDVCVLKRGWDDQSQPRVRLESVAMDVLLHLVHARKLLLIHSTIHHIENAVNPNPRRRAAIDQLLAAFAIPEFDHDVFEARARTFASMGVGSMDAAHLAAAEALGADRLVTTDDRFIRQANRMIQSRKSGDSIVVLGPVQLATEVTP